MQQTDYIRLESNN